MRVVLISDTHTQHGGLELPDGDVLIHAGDCTSRGSEREVQVFMAWLAAQPHRHKILIAGNHDFLAERQPSLFRDLVPDGVTYLDDSGATVEGVEIWGSPVTPWFYDWAFNRERGAEIKAHWDLIPVSTQVLVTHGPPHQILDRTSRGDHAGCEVLRQRVEEVGPRLHVFGHIHEAYGQETRGHTRFVNACVLDEGYTLVNQPVVVDL